MTDSKKICENEVVAVVDQAKHVGVSGYLLGVGINTIGSTHRYGFGADHVLEYKMVLADGSVALVNNDNTTIVQRHGRE